MRHSLKCAAFFYFLPDKKFSFHAFPKRRAAGDDDESEPKYQTAREGIYGPYQAVVEAKGVIEKVFHQHHEAACNYESAGDYI